MLGKLFKHEWKAASRTLLAVHGVVLIFAVLTRIFLEVSGGSGSQSVIAVLMLMLSVMVIFTAVVFTVIFIGFRFYKSVFTDQGYLTNTLPVTPNQIIFSKGLAGIIWEVLDVIIVVAAILVLAGSRGMFKELGIAFRESFRYLFSGKAELSVWLVLILVILTPFVMVIQMYVSIALGNLLSGHKVLGAVGAFVAIYAVQQVIGTITIAITGYKAFSVTGEYTGDAVTIQSSGLQMLNTTMIVSLVVSVIFMIASFFVTKYIMTKKLNLQ